MSDERMDMTYRSSCARIRSRIERQRFTIAHELGTPGHGRTPETPEEAACHRFAAAFLVPGDALIREVGRQRYNFGFGELVEIKQKFGISAAALVMRMRGTWNH